MIAFVALPELSAMNRQVSTLHTSILNVLLVVILSSFTSKNMLKVESPRFVGDFSSNPGSCSFFFLFNSLSREGKKEWNQRFKTAEAY